MLAAPALGLRLGASDAGNDPAAQTTRKAYDLLAEGFGSGFNGPLQLAVRLPGRRRHDRPRAAHDRAATHARDRLRRRAAAQPCPRHRRDRRLPDHVTAERADDEPRQAPARRRPAAAREGDRRRPSTSAARPRSQVDFAHVLSGKLPLFIGVVVLLSALLLLVVFRSLLIPLQAAAMNLLSIAAALGVVQAIFERGWLGGLLGIQPGPIEAFIPVMVFAIVFGLSMDYEVFLVSRIHEEWQQRGDASAAVREGLVRTGRVITAAAAVMIAVFASFAAGDDRVLKLFGLALATAVFLDAIVIRTILLPAVLELLGRRTWAFPHWFDRRLPRLAIEPTPAAEPIPALEEAA